MTDLHTHILPQMDDGAADVAQSIAMLRSEQAQGVTTVVLTPHFYRAQETVAEFLKRRNESFRQLQQQLPEDAPELLLGAEVTWYPSIRSEEQLDQLCLAGTDQILLELPYKPWPTNFLDQLYQFISTCGLHPVLAHVDRYLALQKPAQIEELLDMGLTMQMNAGSLQPMLKRKKMLGMLRYGDWYLGSDCHNMDNRPPCMGQAVSYLQKHMPAAQLQQIASWQP